MKLISKWHGKTPGGESEDGWGAWACRKHIRVQIDYYK